MIFDPIATPAVSLAAHREPQFVFTEEVDIARLPPQGPPAHAARSAPPAHVR